MTLDLREITYMYERLTTHFAVCVNARGFNLCFCMYFVPLKGWQYTTVSMKLWKLFYVLFILDFKGFIRCGPIHYYAEVDL